MTDTDDRKVYAYVKHRVETFTDRLLAYPWIAALPEQPRQRCTALTRRGTRCTRAARLLYIDPSGTATFHRCAEHTSRLMDRTADWQRTAEWERRVNAHIVSSY